MVHRWLLLVALAALAGCHPLSFYDPPELPKKEPLTLSGNPALKAEVEIRVDARGVPHISAQNESDASFALGFMHGRDRQFQLLLLKHAGQGRLTELFGEALLPLDRRLRLSAFGLEAQMTQLAPKDLALLEAYSAGVLAGAKQAGKTAEMALLGKTLDAFTPYDALSILRLQGWQLSQDFQDELVRELIFSRLSPGDPRRKWFDLPAPDNEAIVPDTIPSPRGEGGRRPGEGRSSFADKTTVPVGPASTTHPSSAASRHLLPQGEGITSEHLDPLALHVAAALGLFEHGASNSWVVSGDLTSTGNPMLCNDPHLTHGLPGVFYLAQLTTPDFSVEGATLPGGPMVVIGFAQHLAWGVTAAYGDVQDVLRLTQPPDDTTAYLVDGERVQFETLQQRYVLGRAKDAKVSTETWKVSRFGPVLPQGLGGWSLSNGPYALSWTAYQRDARNANVISSWFELAKAQTLEQASKALEAASSADVSVVLAMTDGTVAYRMEAMAGERPRGATGRTVRAGEHESDALKLVEPSRLPRIDSAAHGFIVAANQRVVNDGDPRAAWVGTAGVEPSRAQRIRQRIEEMSHGGQRPTLDGLISIQQDTTSPQAKRLAPLLGAHCPSQLPGADPRLPAFCEAVTNFDGNFSVDSLRALPFVAFLYELQHQVALSVVSPEEAELISHSPPVSLAVSLALQPHHHGQDLGDFGVLGARAALIALEQVKKLAGDDPRGWRWGKVHRYTPKSPLASAPVLGGFFELPAEEQSGWLTAPRAEGPLDASHGAVLRMGVELSDPPRAKMVLDTGQSGVPRTEHFYDQHDDWNRGTPPFVPFTREEIDAATVSKVLLRP